MLALQISLTDFPSSKLKQVMELPDNMWSFLTEHLRPIFKILKIVFAADEHKTELW